MKDKTDKSTADLFAEAAVLGRPRLHADQAAKQKAYRARIKATGRRIITRVVADVRDDAPLQSGIIDLSQVRLKVL